MPATGSGGEGSVGLQQIIIESLSGAPLPYLCFLDTLDRITPSYQMLIEKLLAVSVVCAAVVHEKESIHLKKVWSSFTRIDIQPLSEDASLRLIRYYLDEYHITVNDQRLYEREILKAAAGNPFHV